MQNIKRTNTVHHVEDVKVPFSCHLLDHPRLLKQVIDDLSASRFAFEIKLNLHVFTEPGRVVVSECFRVAKSFPLEGVTESMVRV
jgi:hypothetical protein